MLMSPAERAYLDIKYDSITKLGLTWAGLTEVDDAYDWALETFEEGVSKENIIGFGSNWFSSNQYARHDDCCGFCFGGQPHLV